MTFDKIINRNQPKLPLTNALLAHFTILTVIHIKSSIKNWNSAFVNQLMLMIIVKCQRTITSDADIWILEFWIVRVRRGINVNTHVSLKRTKFKKYTSIHSFFLFFSFFGVYRENVHARFHAIPSSYANWIKVTRIQYSQVIHGEYHTKR